MERRARDLTTAQAEADITALFRPLSRAVGQSARRHGARYGMTALTYQLVMRDVDAALDGVFGRYRGDPASPLLRLVARRAREGWAWAFGRSAALARGRLRGQVRLLRAIEEEAG